MKAVLCYIAEIMTKTLRILLIILVIVGLGALAYVYADMRAPARDIENNHTSDEIQTSNPVTKVQEGRVIDVTAVDTGRAYKTAMNEQIGVSLRVPADWKIETVGPSLRATSPDYVSGPEGDGHTVSVQSQRVGASLLESGAYEASVSLLSEDINGCDETYQKVLMDGEMAYLRICVVGEGMHDSTETPSYMLAVLHGAKEYEFTFAHPSKTAEPILAEFIRGFRFLGE